MKDTDSENVVLFPKSKGAWADKNPDRIVLQPDSKTPFEPGIILDKMTLIKILERSPIFDSLRALKPSSDTISWRWQVDKRGQFQGVAIKIFNSKERSSWPKE